MTERTDLDMKDTDNPASQDVRIELAQNQDDQQSAENSQEQDGQATSEAKCPAGHSS